MKSRYESREFSFRSLVLPTFSNGIRGLSESTLQSVLGQSPISELVAIPNPKEIKNGTIDFDLKSQQANFPIFNVRAIYDPKPAKHRPASYLKIQGYQMGEGQERGMRVIWTPKRTNIKELLLYSLQFLPNFGETYESGGEIFLNPSQRRLPIHKFLDREAMHVVNIVTPDEGRSFKAQTQAGFDLPMEVNLAADLFEIRAYADGFTFKTPFSLSIPARIGIDPGGYSDTLELFKQTSIY